jgi:hypothetical protein
VFLLLLLNFGPGVSRIGIFSQTDVSPLFVVDTKTHTSWFIIKLYSTFFSSTNQILENVFFDIFCSRWHGTPILQYGTKEVKKIHPIFIFILLGRQLLTQTDNFLKKIKLSFCNCPHIKEVKIKTKCY